jgi:integrase
MAKKRLTDKFVASVKAPKDVVQVDFFDLGYPALALRVGHREKTWTLHRREHGVLKRLKLGRYPEMSLAEAREQWRLNRQGLLVSAAPSVLLAAVVDEWLRAWRLGKAGNSVKAIESQIKVDVLPAWGSRNIADISKRDVLALLDGIVERGAVVRARRVYATLCSFFKWAHKREIIAVNPMATIERKDIGSEEARDRVLTDDELGKLMAHIRGTNAYTPHLIATHLLVLTGARTEMIAAMRWDEINGDVISFPGERMKNGQPFDLPITPQIRNVLDSIHHIHGCPFVFGKALKSWDKAKAKIDAATGLVDWQFRDIRRTVSTGMQRLGISEDVIDAVQAHAKAGIKRVYQRHKYATEKRAALQAWGDWISALPAHKAA